ncbi:MAG: replicative DNA helicase [Desulfonatronovibrionaceae bacterium]
MAQNQNRKNPRSFPKGKESGQGGGGLDRVSADLLHRVPPHNLEAEQAVLGGVFLSNAIMHELIDLLDENDFYSPAHRIIYQGFLELYRKNSPIDLLTVSDHLENRGDLEDVGGAAYLGELAEAVAVSSSALHYAQIVKERSLRRNLIQTAATIISDSFSPGTGVEELLDQAEKNVFAVTDAGSKPVFRSSKELIQDVFHLLEQRVDRQDLVTGIPSGYPDLDEITAGLQPTDLIIVAGRPSMGKTAFALNVGMRTAAANSTRTAVFSLEMSRDQLMMRMLCSYGKVDLKKMRTGFLNDEDWTRLYHAADDLSRAPIYIDDTPALSGMELRARCRRLKAEKGLDMVIVDYLQLMRGGRSIESREQEISEISRSLKSLAKEMDVPVVALSQLNRKVEDRTNRRPMLSDLRESGAIEQDADVIMFLYRDEVYNKKEDNPKKGIAEIIVGKQRNGPVGVVELAYLDRYTAFENLADPPVPSEDEVQVL